MPEYKPVQPLFQWERATIEIFVRAANMVGLPRSIGEIYGLLFCSELPLTFDELVDRLQISKGSVSQGLKLLRQLGAVRLHYVPGSRKDHFEPELSMKRLVKGFVKDQFSPHLESGEQSLQQIETMIENEADSSGRDHAQARLSKLRSWQKRTQKLVPIIMAVLGGAQFLESPEMTKGRREVV